LKLSSSAYEEQENINKMCDFLISKLDSDEFYKQIQAYRYIMLMIRTGGLMNQTFPKAEFYSTNLDFSSKKIALYSSGTFGQAIWTAFLNVGLEFSGWYDEDYLESMICGLKVSPLEDLKFNDIDIVLVATFNKSSFKSIERNIKSLVGKNCIVAQPVIPEDLNY